MNFNRTSVTAWLQTLDKVKNAETKSDSFTWGGYNGTLGWMTLEATKSLCGSPIQGNIEIDNQKCPSSHMKAILSRSEPNACGLYCQANLHAINQYARAALGLPTIGLENYSSDATDGPFGVNLRDCIVQVLKKLSGNFSYDDIASAKACLKEALG